jgi:L-lysine 2,3-aminomutase
MATPLLKQVKTIPVSKRRITRIGSRYLIQLPMQLNELWQYLHENHAVLNLVIEVAELKPRKEPKQVAPP